MPPRRSIRFIVFLSEPGLWVLGRKEKKTSVTPRIAKMLTLFALKWSAMSSKGVRPDPEIRLTNNAFQDTSDSVELITKSHYRLDSG
jgi:hypothetical protein